MLIGPGGAGLMMGPSLSALSAAAIEGGYPFYERNPYVPEEYDVLAYETNFIDGVEITPYGVTEGRRTWVSNGVPGISGTSYIESYNDPQIPADPLTFPTTNPFPVVNGKRQLRAELLDEAIAQDNPASDGGVTITRRTQAHFHSMGVFGFKYGMLEVRFRGPPGRRGGGGTDIWLGANGWPPEIDFGENFTTNFTGDPIAYSLFLGQHFRQSEDGGAAPEAQSGAVVNLNSGVLPKPIHDPITEWRVVACEITPEKVAFYVNGVKLREDDNAAPGVLWQILIRCSTGKFNIAPVDADYPYVAELDYLRFYSKSEDGDQVWHWTPLEPSTDYAWEPSRSCNLTEFSLDDKKASFGGPWGQSSWDDEAPEVFVSKGTCAPGDKMYAKAEVTFTNQFAFGIATGATATVGSALFYPKVGMDYEAFGLAETGEILHGAGYQAPETAIFPTLEPGTYTIELHVDRQIDRAWWKVDDGDWNNDSEADPEAGVGGIDISALDGLLCLAGSLLDPGDSLELLTDGTPLPGYTLWGSPAAEETPWSPADLAVAPLIAFDPDEATWSDSTFVSAANSGSLGGTFTPVSAAPVKATANGHNLVDIDGSELHLGSKTVPAGDIWVVFVTRPGDLNGPPPPVWMQGDSFDDGYGSYGGPGVAESSYGAYFSTNTDEVFINNPTGRAYASDGALHVYLVRLGETLHMRVDGADEMVNGHAAGPYTGSPAAANRSQTGDFFLGGEVTGGAYQLILGDYYLLQNQSSDDLDRLEGYLAWKYGIQGQLDAAHPYKSAPPTVE